MLPIAVGGNTVVGASGSVHSLPVYHLDHVDDIDRMGVYIVYRDAAVAIEQHTFEPIYVGRAETETIAQRFAKGHAHQECFTKHSAKFIGVISQRDDQKLEDIEVDLIKGLNPVCNEQHAQ